MRIIICGGRDYRMTFDDALALCRANVEYGFSEVVSGGARGADSCGEDWARANAISVTRFPAEWEKHGNQAGMIRNEEMAKYADLIMAFPGGRGTDDMVRRAKLNNLVSVNEWLGLHMVYAFKEAGGGD